MNRLPPAAAEGARSADAGLLAAVPRLVAATLVVPGPTRGELSPP